MVLYGSTSVVWCCMGLPVLYGSTSVVCCMGLPVLYGSTSVVCCMGLPVLYGSTRYGSTSVVWGLPDMGLPGVA